MEKNLTLLQVRMIAEPLAQNWDNFSKELHINSKALYQLIGLKKTLLEEGQKINDTIIELFKSQDCVMNNEQTGFIIPPEKQESINKMLQEFYAETTTIDYKPIILVEEDQIPTELMDLLFEFIEFKD